MLDQRRERWPKHRHQRARTSHVADMGSDQIAPLTFDLSLLENLETLEGLEVWDVLLFVIGVVLQVCGRWSPVSESWEVVPRPVGVQIAR